MELEVNEIINEAELRKDTINAIVSRTGWSVEKTEEMLELYDYLLREIVEEMFDAQSNAIINFVDSFKEEK